MCKLVLDCEFILTSYPFKLTMNHEFPCHAREHLVSVLYCVKGARDLTRVVNHQR